ncbi:MAG: HAD family hydrolase [Acidobacteria bacterium]|nr:MAG: HAD family hydrolase [Acidobacteriota bacterium]
MRAGAERPVRAVLLDMDGVLVFSEEAWFLVYNRTLAHFSRPPISRAAFDAIYGNGTKADRDAYMPDRTVEEVDEAYGRFFEEHLEAVRPNEEARVLLAALRERGVASAVATNTQHRLARRVLSLTGLLPLLDAVACADEAGAGKPDPAVLHLAASRLRVPLSDCLFVGDSKYDRMAARSAGVRFAGYRMGHRVRIDSLAEVLPRLAPASGCENPAS